MKTNIDRVCAWIHCGKEQFYNVYYKSGIVKKYYIHKPMPESVKQFIKNSYIYFLLPDVKLYKLTHD